MNEWKPYKIRCPAPGKTGKIGSPLEMVHHVAHLKDSRRILEDGFLRAGLVNDNSRLDTARNCVTFLSANTWAFGSIFGNVRWSFDWNSIIDGKHFHWVEARPGKAYPTYRILISSRKSVPALTPYDPAVDKGPLRRRGSDWYWNGDNIISEFLFDGDIPIADCKEFDVVDHHATYCHRSECQDKGRYRPKAASQTIAFILGANIRSVDNLLRKPNIFRKGDPLSDLVQLGCQDFYTSMTMGKDRPEGSVRKEPDAVALVRGAMALHGANQRDRARDVVRQLADVDVLEKAIETIVVTHFELPRWSLLED
ncbi:hypothetical protein ACDA55_07700 [Rhizobium ruizarguesonis]